MKRHATATATLSPTTQQIIQADVLERKTIEACGVLLGQIDNDGNWLIDEALPLRNVFDSPVYFEFAPEDLLEVELRYSGQIVGVYHSHPTGFPRPSSTDRENMQRVNKEQQIPWVWFIICGPFDERFQQQAVHQLPAAQTKAFHHYEVGGLQEIPVLLAQSTSESSGTSSSVTNHSTSPTP